VWREFPLLGLILGESMAMDCCRLATVGLDNTVENRQAWRELLYSAPGLGNVTSLLPCMLEFLGFAFHNCCNVSRMSYTDI
jgi:hypothetical protein